MYSDGGYNHLSTFNTGHHYAPWTYSREVKAPGKHSDHSGVEGVGEVGHIARHVTRALVTDVGEVVHGHDTKAMPVEVSCVIWQLFGGRGDRIKKILVLL